MKKLISLLLLLSILPSCKPVRSIKFKLEDCVKTVEGSLVTYNRILEITKVSYITLETTERQRTIPARYCLVDANLCYNKLSRKINWLDIYGKLVSSRLCK